MGKIFKSFQVIIDKDKKAVVPTGQKLPEPPPDEAENAEESAEFRELSAELLAGAGSKVKINGLEKGEALPKNDMPDDAPISTADLKQPKPASPKSGLSRSAALVAAIKEKELELVAREEKLREWESSLRERESAILREEERLHIDIRNRRGAIEKDAAHITEVARKSADAILETAKNEAESIVKVAQTEAESIKQKAHKEGFALGEEKGILTGEKQGFHEAQIDWQNLMKETETIINELQTSRMAILKASEEEMVKLVTSFAKAVLKTETLVRKDIILNNIDAALNKISDSDKIVLRINLKDKAMCEAHKEQLLKKLASVSELRIIEDSSLTPGGVKIETGVGTIDATIETQAVELEAAILSHLKSTSQVFK